MATVSYKPVKLNLNYIIIGGLVLVLVIVFAWYWYKQGKKTTTTQALPGELPGNPNSGNNNGASNDEIKNIANDIHEDISGLNLFSGWKVATYDRALLLNDTDIVKLYNTYNTLYQKENEETLTQALQDENFPISQLKLLIARLVKLNCI